MPAHCLCGGLMRGAVRSLGNETHIRQLARCGELEALFAWEPVCLGPRDLGNNTAEFLGMRQHQRGHEAAQKLAAKATERARLDQGRYPLWREGGDEATAPTRRNSGAPHKPQSPVQDSGTTNPLKGSGMLGGGCVRQWQMDCG